MTVRDGPESAIHTSVDMAGEYLLTAYNDPSSLTVHRINQDGTLGERVNQPNPLDTGKYAHQIRATPDNEMVIMITRGNNAPGQSREPRLDQDVQLQERRAGESRDDCAGRRYAFWAAPSRLSPDA